MSNYTDKDKEKATRKAHYHANLEKMRAAANANYARRREAIKSRAMAYYHANRVTCLERFKKYRASNIEARKAHDAAYRAENKDTINARQRERAAAHRDRRQTPAYRARSNAAGKTWRLRHPERQKDKVQRRRAQIAGTHVERVDLKTILLESKGLCGICKRPLDLFGIHFDHIIPLSKGGHHTTANLQATHARCNQLKGAKVG